MKTLAQLFLTKTEQNTITAAVQAAEKTTSGEIVPMVVSKSGNYPQASMVCSGSLALLLSLLFTPIIGQLLWIGPQNMWLFMGIFALFFIPSYHMVQQTDRLKTCFLNKHHVEETVSRAALAAFYSQGLYKTRDENGILLYISVLEKKVWLLADAGINNKIEQSRWDTVIEELTLGIKEKQQCEAICRAINEVGEILQDHFPQKKDDTDELHNLILDCWGGKNSPI